jgi:hypothetical protein
MNEQHYIETIGILEKVNASLRERLAEDNEVCVCGCPTDEHESYGEDGEGCGNDDHECVRTCIAVRGIVRSLREQLADLRKGWVVASSSIIKLERQLAAKDEVLAEFRIQHELACEQLAEAQELYQGHDEAIGKWYEEKIEQLTAKLAIATEALNEINTLWSENAGPIARDALQKITGENTGKELDKVGETEAVKEFAVGEKVQHKVSGYDYGAKPVWIPATVVSMSKRRIKISFNLKSGKELVRYCAASTVTKIGELRREPVPT